MEGLQEESFPQASPIPRAALQTPLLIFPCNLKNLQLHHEAHAIRKRSNILIVRGTEDEQRWVTKALGICEPGSLQKGNLKEQVRIKMPPPTKTSYDKQISENWAHSQFIQYALYREICLILGIPP